MLLISIDPNFLGHFGHYWKWNLNLSAHLGDRFEKAIILANKDFDAEEKQIFETSAGGNVELIRYFQTDAYFAMVKAHPNEYAYLKRFGAELSDFLDVTVKQYPGQKIILYMFVGSTLHAHIICEIIEQYDNVFGYITLLSEAIRDSSEDFDRLEVSYSPVWHERLRILAASDAQQKLIQETIGLKFDVAAHPPLMFDDVSVEKTQPKKQAKTITFFAKSVTLGGLRQTFKLLEKIDLFINLDLTVTIRMGVFNNGRKEYERLLQNTKIDPAKVNFISERMGDAEFATLLQETDIAVIMYDGYEFQPSGILLDTIFSNCVPIVKSRNHLSDLVGRYGCGVAVASLDVDDILPAVQYVQENFEHFSHNCIRAAKHLHEKNSWHKLIDDIADTAQGKKPIDFSKIIVPNTKNLTAQKPKKLVYFIENLLFHIPIPYLYRVARWCYLRIKNRGF